MNCKGARPVALAVLISQLIAVISLSTSAQTSGDKRAAPQEKPLKLRTDEVIVDAVVLDKKSHAVSDLATDDFELYEDGVKQKITSFRFESSASASQTLVTGANTVPSGPRTAQSGLERRPLTTSPTGSGRTTTSPSSGLTLV